MNDIDKKLHDVRNPINNIAMNAELAKLLLAQGGDKSKLKSALDTIVNECKRCSSLLDKFQEP